MKKSVIIALSALLLTTTNLSAFAEGPQQNGDNQQQHGQPQANQPPLQPQGNPQHRQPQGNPQHRQSQSNPQHRQPHGAQPQNAAHHQLQQGRPLPQKYRGEGYQVNDWRARGLKAPPSGHRWQNVDGNYVLMAVTTGVITSIITHK